MMETSQRSTQAASATETPTITPRNLRFQLDPANAATWLGGSRESTLFLNALSILFPPGERFFVASVLAARDRVKDLALQARVRAFCRQEAYHTREHIAYNEALKSVGVDVDRLETELTEYLAWTKQTLSPEAPLLTTCALEHFTAIMAHEMLEHPEYLAGADPSYARLWTWHALEECEHKAVAFDVFREVSHGKRGAEFGRITSMLAATSSFVRFMAKHCLALMRAQGLATNPIAWVKLTWYVFGYPGLMRRIALPYLRYFSKSFHPNDLDDSDALEKTRRIAATWA